MKKEGDDLTDWRCGGTRMIVSYKKLWKLLIDNVMKCGQLLN